MWERSEVNLEIRREERDGGIGVENGLDHDDVDCRALRDCRSDSGHRLFRSDAYVDFLFDI